MINWGAVPAGSVLPFMFTSYDGATGASEAISGLAVTDIEVYKGTSITQRASDAGYTLLDTDGIDVDSVVGLNGFSIDTGDNTDAGFYTAGSFYTVVVSSITADAQTVNFIAGTFRLVPAESSSGVPKVDVSHVGGTTQTAGDLAALVTAVDNFVDTEVAAIQTTLTTMDGKLDTIDNLIDTEIAAIQTTLGTPAGVSLAADIAAIEAQTDDIGVAGAGLTAIPWNAAWDAEVQSEVADALAVYDPPTHAELVSEIDAVQTDVAAVKAETAAILDDTGTSGVQIPDGEITAAKFGAGAIDAAALATDAVNELVAAVLAAVIEGTVTLKQSLQLSNAAAAGKLSGAATTTATLRNLADTIDRIVATVDADGNRTALTRTFE